MTLKELPSQDEFAALCATHHVVPVAVEVLADTETPVSVLRRYAHRSDSLFLLESVEGGDRWARYSFLGLSARARVTVFRDEVVIADAGETRRVPHHGDPLAVLRDLMKRYSFAEVPGLPRFCGGLVGYMTYEMVHFFEPRVPNRLPPEKPLADFMVPDMLLAFDNVRHSLTILALAFPTPGCDPKALYAEAKGRMANLLREMECTPVSMWSARAPKGNGLQAVDAPATYKAAVAKAKEAIYEGECIQIVLSQEFACPAPADTAALYRAQRFVNPSPYMFYVRLGGTTLVGASPETMVRLENRVAALRPIAGTRPRGDTEQRDRELADELLRDEKERAEHLMLVDLGRHELGRVAVTGTVQVTDLMVVERYSHVMHLVSNITADLDDVHDAFDLLKAAFPAGTLSGAPKVRAMELIAELEATPRGCYGGAVGYVSFNGNMDFCITIRTATIEDGRMVVRAGAGIVADSDPEKEHQETVNKAAGVARAVQLLAHA